MWQWKDSSEREEYLSSIFIQHKKSLWGKGRGVLKNRLTIRRNFYNDQDTLIYRPGILNFGIKNWLLIHEFEIHIPLNYNEALINEYWHYSSFMYQVNPSLLIGLKITLGQMIWEDSVSFRGITNDSFENKMTIFRFGPNFLFRF